MLDEMFDRTYQAGRAQMHSDVARAWHRFGAAVNNAFQVLNRVEYDAPWATNDKRAA